MRPCSMINYLIEYDDVNSEFNGYLSLGCRAILIGSYGTTNKIGGVFSILMIVSKTMALLADHIGSIIFRSTQKEM